MKLRKAPSERNLALRSVILDAVGMSRVLRRVAFEIVERQGHEAYFVGIHTGGALLAERMVKLLVESGETKPDLGAVDITLYRDDVFKGLPKPEIGPTDLKHSIEGRSVVLIDDVLFTGRTVRAAMDVLVDYGRPRTVQLAVLVDRGRRELPIQPDYAGVRMQTTAEQFVRVTFAEHGDADRVVLYERSGP
jgi:pyrimidine operon attenuation protein/uracil phosphoribosyltransferase